MRISVAALSLLVPIAAQAAPIGVDRIVALDMTVVGSGNGTLDLRMGTFSGGEIGNESNGFNGDNANNTLPQGGGADVNIFAESYVTTAGKLQDYYELNFGVTTPGDIQLTVYIDLNETGAGPTGGQDFNTLSILDIILNPATITGAPDPVGGDVSSDEQAAINQGYTGGTLLAYLDPEPAGNLPVIEQGAGFADYAIATGIDPFTLDPSDVLLFNFSMNTLNDGAEEIFLDGEVRGSDIPDFPPIPEPGTAPLAGLGLLALSGYAARRRVRRRTRKT